MCPNILSIDCSAEVRAALAQSPVPQLCGPTAHLASSAPQCGPLPLRRCAPNTTRRPHSYSSHRRSAGRDPLRIPQLPDAFETQTHLFIERLDCITFLQYNIRIYRAKTCAVDHLPVPPFAETLFVVAMPLDRSKQTNESLQLYSYIFTYYRIL